ncbi:MAG: hypothetical protein IJJ81_00960 [Ruminococcus sp.]|nr:hypothetical protein [Ruminococcus sp.]
MGKHTKGFLSAVFSAALCTASIPLNAVKAEIIIDHDCSGIDKWYYFEIANSDKDSQPEFMLMPGGNYKCSWDNDEDFSAGRALKFASPVEYSDLANISYKYWKRIDIESFSSDDKSYVRFGVRLHNSRGDVFDILEIDYSPDKKSITEKQGGYKKIGELASKEILNDYSLLGPTYGESKDLAYSLYVRGNEDGKSSNFLCRRDEPMDVNNDIEDQRRININDKLNAIAAAGYDLGEITDIGLFLESSYSRGEATIYTYDISIENMPEIAADEYEDPSSPLIISEYDHGVRTGYYYGMNSTFSDDRMEVIAPSGFKAQWDSRENKYNNDPYFERGKQYERGQSYKAVSGSSMEYTMDFDAEGAFSVSTAAKFSSIEMPEYTLFNEFYIVDACSENWLPSQWPRKLGEFSAEGTEYDVYDGSVGMIGTGKEKVTKRYYFISKDAEANGKKGTVTAKHNMAPYMKYVYDKGAPIGCPDILVAQMNGGVSRGTAELVKCDVTFPDFIADEGEFERETRRIDISRFNNVISVNGLVYGENGDSMTMKGYAGEDIECTWEPFTSPAFASGDHEYSRNFYVGLSEIMDVNGKYGVRNNESLLVDYCVSMGDITAISENNYWSAGAWIRCCNEKAMPGTASSDEYDGCEIVVADKLEGELTGRKSDCLDPQNVGTIESNGVKYDVILTMPEVKENNIQYVLLKRQKQLDPVPGTENRYAGTIDAADITRKLGGLGIETYDIWSAYFSLDVYGNEGTAVINSADVRKVNKKEAVYSDDDLNYLRDFVLGKKADIPEGKDYDLNGDGKWDIYDLSLMRKELVNKLSQDNV